MIKILFLPIWTFVFILWWFFVPNLGLVLYIMLSIACLSWPLLSQFEDRKMFRNFKDKILKHLREDEYKFLEKYAFYFNFPVTSKQFSSLFSILYLIDIISIVVFFFKGNYLSLFIALISIPLYAYFSQQFNPKHFISEQSRDSKRIADIATNLLNEQMIKSVTEFVVEEWPKIVTKHK